MNRRGLTLVEVLTVMMLIVVAALLAGPNFYRGIQDSQGRTCSANLQMLQGAKDQFRNDNPGVALKSESQLAPYLPNGIPHCPAGGTYENVLDLDNPVSCSLNKGIAGMHNLDQPVMKSP